MEKRNGEYAWIHHYIALLDGEPIGFCQYYEYCRSGETWHGNRELEGVYSIDYLIGNAEYLGKGLGKRLIASLIGEIALEPNARQVIVQPARENAASRGALAAAGFAFDEVNELFALTLKP